MSRTRWRLRARVPLRLRVFFRGAFALLALATVALALSVLQDEKQRSQRNYEDGLRKTAAQIVARLRHPTGQLALLNPSLAERPVTPLRPLLLPFSAIDFDDQAKAQQAAEMAGCLVQYPDTSTLCVAVGSNPYAGGFVYLVGSFVSGPLVAHRPGDLDLPTAHRVRIGVDMRGQSFRWVAPFEANAARPGAEAAARGRLTGFVDDVPVTPATRPVRDFRGWLWQDGRCLASAPAEALDAATCIKRSHYSVRLPVELLRDAVARKPPVWPPPDLDRIVVHLQVLAPAAGDGREPPPLFDSDAPGASLPFSLADLRALLLPGELLRVRPLGAPALAAPGADLLRLAGAADPASVTSPWLVRLVRRLPVDADPAPITLREPIDTPLGRHELLLTGDVRTVNDALAAVATRLSGFVGAMLLAVLLTWLAIEARIIRRITLLTRRAAGVATGVATPAHATAPSDGLVHIDLSDLRGSDELGVLAASLQALLQRVNADVRREQIRAAQERDMWQAVGHEIMSPLQSLLALHGSPDDASHRYISRMQQAVRVLYGQATPSEALASSSLQLQVLDLDAFLDHVARNAPYTGIAQVAYAPRGTPLPVRADEYALEDAVTHVLRNAERYRPAGTPIRIALEADDALARVHIDNDGAPIDAALIDRIFEYGVSDAAAAGDAGGHRGQGLFVARTYMAKMGGTIAAANRAGGVRFTLQLQRAAVAPARPAG